MTGTVASVDAACMPAAPHQEPALGDRGPCLVELEAAPRKGRPSCRKCRPRRASSTTDSSTRPTVPRNPGSMRVHIPPPGLPRTPPPPRRDRVIPTPLRPAPLCTAPPLVPDPCPARSRLERAPSLPQASALARKRAPARRLGPGAAPGGGARRRRGGLLGRAGAGEGGGGAGSRAQGRCRRWGGGRRQGGGEWERGGGGPGGGPALCCVALRKDSHSLPGCAKGCPGSTCIRPVWLDRCYPLSLSLPLSLPLPPPRPPPPRAPCFPGSGSPSPPINVLARNQRPGSHH